MINPLSKLELVGAILVVALSFALWLVNGWREEWKVQYHTLQAAEQANTKRHNQEMADADANHKAELERVRNSFDMQPVVIRVRKCSPNVYAGGAPAAGASPAGGVAPEVHAGDSSDPERRRDELVGLLLTAYAQVFAAENADLRQQQQVVH